MASCQSSLRAGSLESVELWQGVQIGLEESWVLSLRLSLEAESVGFDGVISLLLSSIAMRT